jgi:cytoskeletal protein RodZ
MNSGIGEALHSERRRRGLDLDEIEAATKIRGRYLRALEDEDWEALPGGAYTRSFIRTYAGHLGLDGERLADEYRRVHEETEERYPRLEPVSPRRRPGRDRGPLNTGGGLRPAFVAGGLVVLLVGALIGLGLLTGGDDEGKPAASETQKQTGGGGGRQQPQGPPRARLVVRATAPVWVCLIDARNRALLDGVTLAPGAEEGPFESGRFIVAFGNGGFEMLINGDRAQTQTDPNPVGYRIGQRGGLAELPEGQRPDCT